MPANCVPFCKHNNIIYKILCLTCNQGYIGQTSNELHIRINLHRSQINKCNNPSFEIKHFRLHTFDNISISILGHSENNCDRLKLENDHILQQRTLYPYGLNTYLNDINSCSLGNIYKLLHHFNKQTIINRGSRGSHKNSKSLNYIIPIKWLKDNQSEFQAFRNIKKIRNSIFALKIRTLKKIFACIESFKFSDTQYKDLIRDLLFFRIKSDSQIIKEYFNMMFQQKSFNLFNPSVMFNKLEPFFPLKNTKIIVSYSYNKPFSSTVFNYRQTAISDLDLDNIVCICDEFPEYIDNNHQHVITGNLNIMNNNNIRQLLNFGTKFRLNKKLDIKKVTNLFLENINKFILKLSYKHSFPIQAFFEWKHFVLKHFGDFLKQHLNNKNDIYQTFSKEDRKYLENFKQNFIFVPVDKAASNYAIICKLFYVKKILEELHNKNSYEKYTLNKKELIKIFSNFANKINYTPSLHLNLPFLFLTPKFHKNPVKFRFICCTTNSIGKCFNIQLQNVLKQIYGFLKFKYKNSSYFWIIENSLDVLNRLPENPHSVQSYDFENLFNNIPINLLSNILHFIFDTFFIEDELKIDKKRFFNLCNFCFNNNYLCFNKYIFKQIKGVGMGTNYSSTAANLFLFYFEFKYVIQYSKKLKIFRFIDDVLIFNYDFDNEYKKVYPNCLQLNKANSHNSYVNFLDLSITIHNNNINLDVYDKRNDFNFPTISMPHWFSNLSKRIFVNIVICQFLRFKNICNNKKNLQKQMFKLIAKLFYNNHYPLNFISYYEKICK